jgi:hypothetical protein
MRRFNNIRRTLPLVVMGFASTLATLGLVIVPAFAAASHATVGHHATASHTAHVATIPRAPTSHALIATLTRAGSPGNESDVVGPECVLFYMNQQENSGGVAHISSFLYHNHKIRAVEINAKIQCRRASISLFLQVTLWKTGTLFPHKQAGPATSTAAKGSQLQGRMAWRQCDNNTRSTFYGTAYATAVFQGVKYSTSLQSKNATLACGT